ncbi:hypothetical protein B296_00013454 [Ensete ventricosum]|uniref:Uncharacterized protein n=1 Tax=Ensete ventricosum TaxID=4639 RepID=A0A427A4X2_ENSVE|nr:hypothetical protein B296_00013454 [Ensete ventricosum]
MLPSAITFFPLSCSSSSQDLVARRTRCFPASSSSPDPTVRWTPLLPCFLFLNSIKERSIAMQPRRYPLPQPSPLPTVDVPPLPTPPPAAMQLSTTTVPFFPRRTTSRCDSIAAATIFLFNHPSLPQVPTSFATTPNTMLLM